MIIVCLASSRKRSGRCIAGKELSGGRLGQWARPMGGRQQFESGEVPKVLDVIGIPVTQPEPDGCQTENRGVDAFAPWRLKGRARWRDVQDAVDPVPRDLWLNGFSSAHGMNDRLPEERSNELSGSLLLIQPESLVLRVGAEGEEGKRRVRGEFFHNARRYALAVTDRIVESAFLPKPDGAYPVLDECLLTLSVSLPWDGFRYKLIAAVITDEPA